MAVCTSVPSHTKALQHYNHLCMYSTASTHLDYTNINNMMYHAPMCTSIGHLYAHLHQRALCTTALISYMHHCNSVPISTRVTHAPLNTFLYHFAPFCTSTPACTTHHCAHTRSLCTVVLSYTSVHTAHLLPSPGRVLAGTHQSAHTHASCTGAQLHLCAHMKLHACCPHCSGFNSVLPRQAPLCPSAPECIMHSYAHLLQVCRTPMLTF